MSPCNNAAAYPAIADLLHQTAQTVAQIQVANQAIGTFAHPTGGLVAIAVVELAKTIDAAKAGLAAQMTLVQSMVADLHAATRQTTQAIAQALEQVGIVASGPVTANGEPIPQPEPTIAPTPAPADPVFAPAIQPAPEPQEDTTIVGEQQIIQAANSPVAERDSAAIENATATAMAGDQEEREEESEDAIGPSSLAANDERDEYVRQWLRDESVTVNPRKGVRQIAEALRSEGCIISQRRLSQLIREVKQES